MNSKNEKKKILKNIKENYFKHNIFMFINIFLNNNHNDIYFINNF